MLIVVLGAAAVAAVVCTVGAASRLWRAVPRRNADLVLF